MQFDTVIQVFFYYYRYFFLYLVEIKLLLYKENSVVIDKSLDLIARLTQQVLHDFWRRELDRIVFVYLDQRIKVVQDCRRRIVQVLYVEKKIQVLSYAAALQFVVLD